MKHLKMWENFKNKLSNKDIKTFIKDEYGLVVVPSSIEDYAKLISWLDESDYYAEVEKDYLFFPENNLDSLENELNDVFLKNGISATFEKQE